MTDQVETKQVTWEDLEVAEEQESPPKGVRILQGIDEGAWNESVERFYEEDFRRMQLIQVAQAFRLPPAEFVDNNNMFPEDMERMRDSMGYMSNIHRMSAVCTPFRGRITGRWEAIPIADSE